jgi:hypothetical protein
MNILFLDIETSPNTAYVWGLFKENIPLDRVIESSEILCWAAKWFGDDNVIFDSTYKSGKKRMLKRMHALLEKADTVVHYNGSRFDIPTLNKEFLLAGLGPPAPYKELDLYRIVRTRFRFTSNKLAYVSEHLGLSGKKRHTGFSLWVRCLEGDKDAWKEMEEYNTQDVVVLEELYEKLLPWVKKHPNHNMYTNDGPVCTNCGSGHVHARGVAVTAASRYPRFQCQDCGSWFRGIKTDAPKDRYVAIS